MFQNNFKTSEACHIHLVCRRHVWRLQAAEPGSETEPSSGQGVHETWPQSLAKVLAGQGVHPPLV
jgi:hypothetical protein